MASKSARAYAANEVITGVHGSDAGQILSARLNKSPEKVQEILDVLTPLYEAWIVLAPKESIVSLSVAQEAGLPQAANY